MRMGTGTPLHADPGIACVSTHRGASARALVPWYATGTGTGRLGTIGKWLGITNSDLRRLIRRHRRRSPHYFSPATTELFPELTESARQPAFCSPLAVVPRTVADDAAAAAHLAP